MKLQSALPFKNLLNKSFPKILRDFTQSGISGRGELKRQECFSFLKSITTINKSSVGARHQPLLRRVGKLSDARRPISLLDGRTSASFYSQSYFSRIRIAQEKSAEENLPAGDEIFCSIFKVPGGCEDCG